jgi:hypothetical protein
LNLHVLLFKFLAAVSPAATQADAHQIVDGIVYAVANEESPVFGSREADAIVLGYTAWAESGMHLRAVGDHGKAFGAFQLHQTAGKGTPRTQARAALGHFRRDALVCRRNPMEAFMSGGCLRAHNLATHRMVAIMAALKKARLTRG